MFPTSLWMNIFSHFSVSLWYGLCFNQILMKLFCLSVTCNYACPCVEARDELVNFLEKDFLNTHPFAGNFSWSWVLRLWFWCQKTMKNSKSIDLFGKFEYSKYLILRWGVPMSKRVYSSVSIPPRVTWIFFISSSLT